MWMGGGFFILDGFDEMPDSIIEDLHDSLIMRLIYRKCLPRATRLITSRPSALHHKEKCFPIGYRHVEILGFTDEHKVKFADKTFETQPEIPTNLIQPNLMYIPINCARLVQVYSDLLNVVVPKTMTMVIGLSSYKEALNSDRKVEEGV